MHLSRVSKVVLSIVLAIGVVVFLVLADYGINAGRIHYGVSIGDVNVGGMTEAEAIAALDEHVDFVDDFPVVFTAEGMDCSFEPEEFALDPLSAQNAAAARRVGFRDFPFGALSERVRAWFEGVEVEWETKARKFWKVTEHVDECEAQGEAIGETVRPRALRIRMRIAILTWPRRPFRIPLEEGV
ncbi:MAG: hypothetical protein ACRDKT_04915 [Actinomycetota bacterium]